MAILAWIVLSSVSGDGGPRRAATSTPKPSALAGKPGAVPPGPGALVALVLRATPIRAAPGGRELTRLGARTEFGSPEMLWVTTRTPGWLAVVSPKVGNGRVGWIQQSDAALERNPYELLVSLSARRLTVLDGGSVLQRYTIAIGRPDAPTPTGRFAVTDRLVTGNSGGPYGCCLLALSALAPHSIQGWGGGNRIAIHSTPDQASIGQPVSHGCLHVTLAEGRWLLDHVPLGTPTVIHG